MLRDKMYNSPFTFLRAYRQCISDIWPECACGMFILMCVYARVLKSHMNFKGGHSRDCVNFTASTNTKGLYRSMYLNLYTCN